MNISELFKNSFKYPTKDWGKVLILGLLIIGLFILMIIAGISLLFAQAIPIAIIFVIALIFAIIVGLIYSGYGLSVIRETIFNKNVAIDDQEESLPEFKWSDNIVDGLKVLVLNIVYMIIPVIITLVFAYALGVFSEFASINQSLNIYNQTGAYLPNSIATGYMVSNGYAVAIVNTVAAILSVIFSLFAFIAMAKLAESGKLGSIIKFREINDTISRIGWGNYIVWFILLYIIVVVISFIAALIIFIPIIGFIIYLLIIPSFLTLFQSRSIGLIYNEANN
ncbi:hypothetical protein MARBORIA2_07280 [Methanobrevibacter arboriphilus]|jgi:hypothetical protein|uniref:Uncharacterized protein n=1 Tax=Methanobrevibacter arboriphilus TaxID=39441 RepID=A0ACA8R4H2_METAZ|nr:DUF4013 domain-containing protein [Methanobrevibacter arboriphilus]MCC7561544.1 DUF4013 domain-containing protein [Methanobrevibacter arboriphilus]BBL62496.1 hypothetical protein MarbSA_15360 [Methanobrevibacter arboriphilus]GLI11638.1 hypothetical protein MARBORIA2_07280 [Methanobrevibacter arboriphilus]